MADTKPGPLLPLRQLLHPSQSPGHPTWPWGIHWAPSPTVADADPGRHTSPPSIGMFPRALRTRQSLALTITWLAMSLTSRSRPGSPSPGFPVPQTLLCCKEKLQ